MSPNLIVKGHSYNPGLDGVVEVFEHGRVFLMPLHCISLPFRESY